MTLRHTQKESKVYISCQTEIQKASNKKRLQKGCQRGQQKQPHADDDV